MNDIQSAFLIRGTADRALLRVFFFMMNYDVEYAIIQSNRT